jgi:hypothetical protein
MIFGVYLGALNPFSFIFIGLTALTSSLIMLKIKALGRSLYCLTAISLVLLVFSFSGSYAKRLALKETRGKLLPQVFDTILSPMPANPFCWTMILIDGDEKDYRLHRGIVNLAPKLGECPDFFRFAPRELLRSPAEIEKTAHIEWQGFFKTTYRSLFEATKKNCELKAWLQFTRAPIKEGYFYSDARFPGGRGSFASLDTKVQNGVKCPPYPAPWEPPFEYEKLLK